MFDKDDGDGPPAKKQKTVLQPPISEVEAESKKALAPSTTTSQAEVAVKVETTPAMQPPPLNDENKLPNKPSEPSVVCYMESVGDIRVTLHFVCRMTKKQKLLSNHAEKNPVMLLNELRPGNQFLDKIFLGLIYN